MSALNWQAVVAGVGGQGVLFVTRALASAAQKKTSRILISEVHGMAQRGGAVLSHLKVGGHSGPLVAAGRADLVFSLDPGEAVRNLAFLAPGGILVVNAPDLEFLTVKAREAIVEHRVRTVCADASGLASGAGAPKGANVVLLGAAAAAGALPLDTADLKEALMGGQPAQRKKMNRKLFVLGQGAV